MQFRSSKLSILLIITTLLLLVHAATSKSQPREMKFLYGGGITGSYSFNPYPYNRIFSINISPSFGYFIDKNFALGGQIFSSYTLTEYYSIVTETRMGIAPFARYYWGDCSTPFILFSEVSLGPMFIYTKSEFHPTLPNQYNNTIQLQGTISSGVAWFPTSFVSIEGSLRYSHMFNELRASIWNDPNKWASYNVDVVQFVISLQAYIGRN